jgi:hypothetical protein
VAAFRKDRRERRSASGLAAVNRISVNLLMPKVK